MAQLSRLIRSIVSGILAGVGAAFVSAVVLAVINLYLTGHNITWQERTVNIWFISLSFLDFTMLAVTFFAMIAAAYFSYHGRR